MELPDDDGRVEVRPGARRGQHGRPQALGHHPRLHGADRRDHRLGAAQGRLQRHLRRPRHRPHDGRARHPGDGLHHRFRARRHVRRRVRLQGPQAGPPGAGRQGPGRRLRGHRHRQGRRGHLGGGLLQRRPGLYGGLPRPRPRVDPRRVRDRARQGGRGHQDRPARRRGRALRPAQQRQPAQAGRGLHRAAARPRPRPGRRQAGRRQGLLLRADRGLRPQAGRRDHPEGGLRTGHHRPVLHRRGPGRRVRQRRRVRPRVLGVDQGPRARDAHVEEAGLRLRVDQHAHPAGRGDAARRVQEVRLRQGPVGVRLRGLHPDQARDDVAGRVTSRRGPAGPRVRGGRPRAKSPGSPAC
ncbi:putative Uncharacterized 50.6 kDa protein in the 5'region of gyrA and gyrB [Streptomyces misionensis JCM 4497]